MSTFVHHKRNFFDFFPTPKYLEMPSVGIDISDQVIRFVEIEHRESGHSQFRLKSFGQKKIADGVVTSGVVNKPEEVKKLLTEIKKEHGFRFASISLPEEKGYLFKTELPDIEEKYFAENIELRLEENAPVDASKSVFNYHLIKNAGISNGMHAVVMVVPNNVVDSYTDLFRDTSIVPVSYQLVTQAVARAVVPQDEVETCLIIYFGDVKTGFGIVSDGALQFTSTIKVGHATGGADAESKKTLLKDEVVKLNSYWQSHNENGDKPIKRVIISGKGATALGLKEYLAEVACCRADLANVWVNVFDFGEQIPEMSFEESLDYAPAIGLAILRFYHA